MEAAYSHHPVVHRVRNSSQTVGLVGTLAATTILASAAGTLLRPLALAMLVAIMVAANVGIFVFALNMPIGLWPAIF